MAHKVTFALPDRQLGKSDLEFQIKRNGRMEGRLLVSKGGIVWRAKNAKKGAKLNWRRFGELVWEHGRPEWR